MALLTERNALVKECKAFVAQYEAFWIQFRGPKRPFHLLFWVLYSIRRASHSSCNLGSENKTGCVSRKNGALPAFLECTSYQQSSTFLLNSPVIFSGKQIWALPAILGMVCALVIGFSPAQHTHTHTHTHTQTNTHIHSRTHVHTREHTYTCTYTHAGVQMTS